MSDPATTAAEEPVRRRRGRPRKGESDARDRILAAATDEFGEHGYDASTTRAIAGRAGVDPALLHHHFGTKADLFAASIGAPLRPDLAVPEILTGPREQTGERLVAYVLAMWDSPTVGPRALVMLRTSLASKRATPLLAGFLRRELLDKVAAARAALTEVLTPEAFSLTAGLGERLATGLRARIARAGLPWSVNYYGSHAFYFFSPQPPRDARGARDTDDPDVRALIRVFLANRGVWESGWWLGPTVSVAHSSADVDIYLDAIREFIEAVA